MLGATARAGPPIGDTLECRRASCTAKEGERGSLLTVIPVDAS